MIDESRYATPKQYPFLPNYVVRDAFLSVEECDNIRGIMEATELKFATIGNGGNDTYYQDLEYRTVKMGQVPTDELGWLYSRVMRKVEEINELNYRFDLTGLTEDIQYLKYEMPEGNVPAGHYNWHQDFGGGYSSLRKLSVVVQLSDTLEYDECDLRAFTNRDEWVPNRNQGSITVFPAYIPHCVTPIERGTRRALVTWVSGPQFR